MWEEETHTPIPPGTAIYARSGEGGRRAVPAGSARRQNALCVATHISTLHRGRTQCETISGHSSRKQGPRKKKASRDLQVIRQARQRSANT